MKTLLNRRHFLRTSTLAGTVLGLGDFGFLSRLPRVSAAEATLDPGAVRFDPSIEPLVRFLEDTPRERLLEETGAKIRRGLNYRELLAALLLAGVRNIQPRPVGFKFHAVLVVNSAHLASLSSPETDRWLPIFWALDYFKNSQAQDVHQGDWTMGAVQEKDVPPSDKAPMAFVDAMENWDAAAADAAVTGLARTAGAHQVFEIFCRFGCRDFREIGHKAIYVSNAWRTLQCIGWQHAEPVLRSLAYALLDHEGDNPARRDAPADRPGRRNRKLLASIEPGWLDGKIQPDATRALLETLRHASSNEASDQVIAALNRGVSPRSVWDALFDAAGELLMRRPGILSLHASTATNALHYAFEHAADEDTRKILLLQTAAFLPLFRGDGQSLRPQPIEELEAAESSKSGPELLEEIFVEISQNRLAAARKVLAYLEMQADAQPLIDTARRLIFLKGSNPHDYKFSSAVLEDFYHVSPPWRNRFLAASVFNLRGSGGSDNTLVQRTRAALEG